MKPDFTDGHHLSAHLFRHHSGKMLAVLTRQWGIEHLDTLSDIVQDSFESALKLWKFGHIPAQPEAWLMTVAKNKAKNHFSTLHRRKNLAEQYFLKNETSEEIYIDLNENDPQLSLLMACCSLQIPYINRLQLTLHILCGFGSHEIAAGLLLQEESVRKAIYRSKKSLALSSFTYSNAIDSENIILSLNILYLMFNEGYKSSRHKDGMQTDICYEAIRLSLLLQKQFPEHHDINALLALMFLHAARFSSRLNSDGDWLTLEEQDRSLWDNSLIKEGLYYLRKSEKNQVFSAIFIEALIASCHACARHFEETPWEIIAGLYEKLEQLSDSPMITINKLIAESYFKNKNDILIKINELNKFTESKRYILEAAKAHVLLQMNRKKEAVEHYLSAANFADAVMDKKWLQNKASQVIQST